MARKRKGRIINGILLLDKPKGISSNRALQQVKRMYDAAKAGYIGTLDPLATGMLPICFGKATKLSDELIVKDKAYQAVLKLGEQTETGDSEGEVCLTQPVPELTEELVTEVLQSFLGDIEQVPPMYSALKHNGQPLYKLAREGKTVERKARTVTIYSIQLDKLASNELTITASCSKGTYIRTLAEDIAKKLGTCAHLIYLRRLYCAGFKDKPMQTIAGLDGLDQAQLDQILLAV